MKKRIAIPFLAAGLVALCASGVRSEQKPLKVFILAGQSNMQGHARVSTFDAMRLDPRTAPILDAMRNDDGTPRVCENVWISSIGSADKEQIGRLTAGFGAGARGPKIGPEFTFGIYAHELLNEPILLIKTAWGGKSLNTDFRPPSAGPYEFNETQRAQLERQGKDLEKAGAERAKATGRFYRLMIDHVKTVLADVKRVYPDYDPEQGHELAGFVWFQGWNDMVDRGTYPDRGKPGGYDAYSDLLARFIRDVRKELSAPKLPFVIGVMGVGGPVEKYAPDQQRYKGIHQNFRTAMAAPASLPEFEGNVSAVLTEKFWDMEVVRLKSRERQLKPKVTAINDRFKAGELTRKERDAALDGLYSESFTAHELEVLKKSVSNADYHYMGSAKVMAQIGKAFAESLVAMLKPRTRMSGNPVFDGWYADPEGVIFGDTYWIYPTYSARYREQVFFDCFSSKDLVTWRKHSRVLDADAIQWARRAMWAPSIVEKDGRYYFFFGANDIQNDEAIGGIGVAVADTPSGPFKDHLGKPLIGKFHNGAQPIDQFVFKDADGTHYLIYGGWRHCNIARLNDEFSGFIPFDDGTTFKEITPEGYVEGPFMFIRDGNYYFMWSEGGWTGPNYSVAYAIADSPFGPFKRIAKVLKQDPKIATGAGHHSVIHVPGTDEYYAVYHRRPLGETDGNSRVTCIDRMEFDQDGFIKPIRITHEGVPARPLK